MRLCNFSGIVVAIVAAVVLAGNSPDPERQRVQREVARYAPYFARLASVVGTIEGEILVRNRGRGDFQKQHATAGEFRYYSGILTPPRATPEGEKLDRDCYVVSVVGRVEDDEQFALVSCQLARPKAEECQAELVGRHAASGLVVFRLIDPERSAVAVRPEPVVTIKGGDEEMLSLAHVPDSKKKGVEFAFARGRAVAPGPDGAFVEHLTVFGAAHDAYWFGGPLLVAEQSRGKKPRTTGFKVAGLNLDRGSNGHPRALPFSRVIEIRDEVIVAAREAATKKEVGK